MANQREKRSQTTAKERADQKKALEAVRQDWTEDFGIAPKVDADVYVMRTARGTQKDEPKDVPSIGVVNAVIALAVNDLRVHAEVLKDWLGSIAKDKFALSLTVLIRGSLPQGLRWNKVFDATKNKQVSEPEGFRQNLEMGRCGILVGPEREVPQFHVVTGGPCGVTGSFVSAAGWHGRGITHALNSPVAWQRNAGQVHTLAISDNKLAEEDLSLMVASFLSGVAVGCPSAADAVNAARSSEVTPVEDPDRDFDGFFD